MALSSYQIKLLKGSRRIHGIEEVQFATRDEFVPTNRAGKPPTGRILPKGKGFTINTQLPSVDFKVLRAMLAAGEKGAVNDVLRTKRRSIVTPDRLWDNILAFGKETAPRIKDDAYKAVLEELREQFVLDKKIKPLDYRTAAGLIPQNTNPGFPFIEIAPGLKKGQVIQKYINQLEQEWLDTAENRNMEMPDCAAFARTAVSDPSKNKVRPVWAYPISVVIAEAMFAIPIADEMKKQKMFLNTAFGMEMMCGGMEFINGQAHKAKSLDPGCKFIMTDYSAFDSSVPAWLIRDCFQIVLDKFDLSQNGKYYKNAMRRIVGYFINTPVRNPDGRRFLTDHGIPSGTMFTNILGTMCNFVISRYLMRVTTGTSPIFDVYFGDDALICMPERALVNMENISFQAKKAFCMTVSSSKSYWTRNINNIHFLGSWNAFGTPYKPELDIYAAMVYPQYAMDDWAYALSRSMGCVAAAAGQSPGILHTAQLVMLRASNVAGKIDEAENLVREQPRMVRFFETMGIDPKTVGVQILTDSWRSIPTSVCMKQKKGIDLCVYPAKTGE